MTKEMVSGGALAVSAMGTAGAQEVYMNNYCITLVAGLLGGVVGSLILIASAYSGWKAREWWMKRQERRASGSVHTLPKLRVLKPGDRGYIPHG